MRTTLLVLLLLVSLAAPGLAPEVRACFGTELRIGISSEPARALASWAAGYYVEEKTGIAPDFREVPSDPGSALAEGSIDLWLAPAGEKVPPKAVSRSAGKVPGFGEAVFWLRPEVLDDIRFTTLDRALGGMAVFFGSPAYREAASGPGDKKAARKAALHAD